MAQKETRKMKKAAIITLYGLNNYGNRLQNYAMQVILNRVGIQAETIRINFKRYPKLWTKTQVKYIFRPFLDQKKREKVVRQKRFFEFEKNIRHARYIPENILDERELRSYDYFIFGSDQIWNAEFSSFSKFYLGYDTPTEKNIAVSASFGTDDIAPKYRDLFTEGLHNFKAISVRENVGAEIIRRYTDIDCIVTPDPTLVVSMKEWCRVEKRVSVPENYVFTYFLGDMPAIDFGNTSVIHGETTSGFGPAEFIYLIHNAKTVYTDSFHASVFSIIFGVPFYIFRRKGKYSSMMSRIDTLIDLFSFSYQKNEQYYYISREEVKNPKVEEKLCDLSNVMDRFLRTNLFGGVEHEG